MNHPGKIGSSWTGKNYIHGPRKHQPSRYSAFRIGKPDSQGKRIVWGKVKGTNNWERQSTLKPRTVVRTHLRKGKHGKSIVHRHQRRIKRRHSELRIGPDGYPEGWSDFRKKKDKEKSMYKELLSTVSSPDDKAIKALQLSAELHRRPAIEDENTIREVALAVNDKPLASIGAITGFDDKGRPQVQKLRDIKLNREESEKFARDLHRELSDYWVRKEAEEALARELYGIEYMHNLSKEQKSHISYLIRKQAGRIGK